MKTDQEIKRDVEAELRFCPDIDDTDVAVKLTGGVVALSGFVSSYYEKYASEKAIKRVAGVVGIANDIQVRLAGEDGRDDPELARAAVAAIKAQLPEHAQSLKVLVHDGHVTLEGAVHWHFQREGVENAVRYVRGIKALSNHIVVTPCVKATEVKRLIEDAFRRSAEVDANGISVAADGGEVTLIGKVRTWTEREQAQRTAWSAPGVTGVRNQLSIST